MPDAPVPPLVVYPQLWRRSHDLHPHNWRDQFRCLCALARDYRREHARRCNALPEGERLFLQALDQCDVEDLITSMIAWADPGENPLQRFDPGDPHLQRLNGHEVLDA
jgi:hypothetical protein